jgi:hypothetical protein
LLCCIDQSYLTTLSDVTTIDKNESLRARASQKIISIPSPRKREQMESLLRIDVEMSNNQPQEDEVETIEIVQGGQQCR